MAQGESPRDASALKRAPARTTIREKLFLKLFVKHQFDVTEEEVEYFRERPDEIDEITAPVNVHKLFLLAGMLLGVAITGISKVMKFSSVLASSEVIKDFVVDITFEVGVALIGAGVTAYLLGILLNVQQLNAENWRREIRSRIGVPMEQGKPIS